MEAKVEVRSALLVLKLHEPEKIRARGERVLDVARHLRRGEAPGREVGRRRGIPGGQDQVAPTTIRAVPLDGRGAAVVELSGAEHRAVL